MSETAKEMARAADSFLAALPRDLHQIARYSLNDPAWTQWTYMPRPRPGVSLLQLDHAPRKAAHQLLATALSRHTFAQALTIMAFEELLDHDEHGRRARHSDDYRTAIFGAPGDQAWGWRFEGHHLSVTATLIDGQATVAPLFLGLNPARIDHHGQNVVAPLWREEEYARTMVAELPPDLRSQAVVAATAPADITTAASGTVDGPLQPAGVSGALLPTSARDLLERLIGLYVDRMTPKLARHERSRLAVDQVSFAWAGPLRIGHGHYYRMQAPGLLIEYDNTQNNANHAHTVLRRPGTDFGGRLLREHLDAERP